jgi:hypothetical protein
MAKMRMSAWAACRLIQERGIETVLHFPTRGRNLLRLQGDLLGAAALGIRNLFVCVGDPVTIGDYPQGSNNVDVTATGLLAAVFLVWLAARTADLPRMLVAYGAVFAAFLAVRSVAFGVAHARLGRAVRPVPQVSPLRWMVIGETPEAWIVGEYRIGKGMLGSATYPKLSGTTAAAAAPYLDLPEIRRVRYHSYITTAERDGTDLVVADPLRTSRRIFYPPYFAEARVPLQESAGPGIGSNS